MSNDAPRNVTEKAGMVAHLAKSNRELRERLELSLATAVELAGRLAEAAEAFQSCLGRLQPDWFWFRESQALNLNQVTESCFFRDPVVGVEGASLTMSCGHIINLGPADARRLDRIITEQMKGLIHDQSNGTASGGRRPAGN